MRDSMWALTYDRKTDPWESSKGLKRTEVQRPTLDEAKQYTDAGMVMIRTQFAGFCGSDRGIWFRTIKTDGCVGCHQLGDKATRTIPAHTGIRAMPRSVWPSARSSWS